jgi:hypothetical protein
MKSFLAAGDVLINPALLAYASVETDTDGIQLRLGFAGPSTSGPRELRLTGLEARSVLRWLRTHAEFLDSGNPTLHRSRAAAEPSPAWGAVGASGGCPDRAIAIGA